MNFFRKSLLRKFFLFLIVLFVVAFGVGLGFWKFPIPNVPIPWVYGGLLGLFALISFFTYVTSVSQPLSKILKEMKAMLTGREYNRVYTDRIDEWAILAHFFNEVSQNVRQLAHTVEEEKRMSAELQIASEIQKDILPKSMPAIPGLDVYANTRPAVEIGGDSYDFIRANQNNFIYIGDATGHGVPAALVMVMVNTLAHTFCELYPTGYDVLTQMNRLLKPRLKPTMFMTLVMLRWQELDKKLFVTGAGHEHILHFHKAQNQCEVRKTGGIAIGMLPDNSKIIKEEQVPLEVGDTLVLYSDGIVDARNTAGDMFGLNRLKELVEKYTPVTKTAHELFTSISTDFTNFVEDQIQQDDMSLMIIRRQA